MTTLSNEDVKRELGKKILVHPFKLNKLKGASLNLTASKLGWCLQTKESIYCESESALIIPPLSTGLIETEETIYADFSISGTYHSKVALVSKGIGHIGTTLDPDWVGPSLIALHNHTNENIKINIGASFVSIVFSYLKTKSSLKNTNNSGRPELLKQFKLTPEEDRWLDEDWRCDADRLRDKMKSNDDFVKIKKGKFYWAKNTFTKNIFALLFCVFVFSFLHLFKTKFSLEYKDFLPAIIVCYLTITLMQIFHKN